MIAVVVDTNAVHGDPWLTSSPGTRLLDLAAGGACAVIYPQVVVDELLRQRREAARNAHTQAAKGVSDMAKAGVDVSATSVDLEASFNKIEADLAAAFDALLARDGVSAEPLPAVPITDLLSRDLLRRRPFIEIELKQKPASVGFRDTLIWETVLAVMDPVRGYEKVLFVTADKGFLSDDSLALHEDLIEDLRARALGDDRAVSIKNIPHAVGEVEAAAAQANLITLATNALYELVGKDITEQMVYGGDYALPDFVDFDVPFPESAYISEIDQISEFTFVQAGDVVTATAEAVIYIEGAVFKSDWFMDDTESVQIHGELNKHYFEASSEATVQVVVELDASEESPTVTGIILRENADEADAAELAPSASDEEGEPENGGPSDQA